MTENELTQLHGRVIEALDLAGIAHEDEYAITVKGQDYQLDCFLPDYHACVEVDGPSHGLRGRKDRARDALLLSVGIPTIRLNWEMIEFILLATKTAGLARVIARRLADIEGDIDERRKKREKKDALWN